MRVDAVALRQAAAANSPADPKLRRAAQEFEAELLSCLLGPMQQAFSGLSDAGDPAGSDQYGYLGIQALAAALAHSGGIGIGKLVLSQIAGTKGTGGRPDGAAGVISQEIDNT